MVNKTNEIILFENQNVKLEVNLKDENVWLTQAQMAELFGRDQSVVARHIRNIFVEKEVEEEINLIDFLKRNKIFLLLNIGVWAVEQAVDIDFEFLSVSYIISELFLLSLHLLLEENKHQKELLDSANAIAKAQSIQLQELTSHISCTPPSTATAESAERFKRFSESVNTLTPTEYTIYNYYLEKKTTKEVLELLNIKENTLKFHNKTRDL